MKEKLALVLTGLLAISLAGCGAVSAPAASSASGSNAASAASSTAASGSESSAVSMLAEQPTAEEVVDHIQNGKSNWVGRTITCEFDEKAKTCVTTIAVDNGGKILEQAKSSDSKMASLEKTMASYAKYNADIQDYLTSGGYDGFTCTMVICDADDASVVMGTVDGSNTLTVSK